MRRLRQILPGLLSFCLLVAVVGMQTWNNPRHFPQPSYNFSRNPLSESKVQLGRALFYDPILSADGTISCASCHSPYNAFAHTDHDLSHGIDDQIGTRNAPALFNLAWQPVFMWDGAVNHLDMQALAPITHPKEMGTSMADVVEKLGREKMYKGLFFDAFQDSIPTGEHVLKALSQFQLTLVSATARYDSMRWGKVKFNQQESRGYALFKRHCNVCHKEPLFSNFQFANNGLPVDSTLSDFGRMRITMEKEDSLLFKTPSLRNLAYTFPYMHDGRFKKLNQVLNHYGSGIQSSATLSRELKNGLQLSPTQKVDLIAFLHTLNDPAFVFDPKHQFPRILLPPAKD